MGTGRGWGEKVGDMAPLEIWDYEVIIRKPKEKKAE
jgi:hypothetical protein